MAAAILQGVEGTTRDIDLWLDLPVRQYMRAINLSLRAGAQMLRNTVVELEDGTLVNFVYEVTGLKSFRTERREARTLRFHGMRIPVLPLTAIRRSKAAILRPKDLIHIEMINRTLRGERLNKARKSTKEIA